MQRFVERTVLDLGEVFSVLSLGLAHYVAHSQGPVDFFCWLAMDFCRPFGAAEAAKKGPKGLPLEMLFFLLAAPP